MGLLDRWKGVFRRKSLEELQSELEAVEMKIARLEAEEAERNLQTAWDAIVADSARRREAGEITPENIVARREAALQQIKESLVQGDPEHPERSW